MVNDDASFLAVFYKNNLDFEPVKIVKFNLQPGGKWVKSRNEAKVGLPEDNFDDEEDASNFLNRLVNCYLLKDQSILLVTMFSVFLFEGDLRGLKQLDVD